MITMTQQNPYDKAIKQTILDPYFYFYEKMKDKFTDEQAMQSAIATCMIRYSNLYDKNPNFNELIKNLMKEIPKEPEPLNDVILYTFKPLMDEYDKARIYIENKLKEPIYDFNRFREDLSDYMYRNRMNFKYTVSLKPITEDD